MINLPITLSIFASLGLLSCGDRVKNHIDALIAGGPEGEEAQIELIMAKKTAIIPLITAFQNREHPTRARIDLAQALYRLYLREADPRVLAALTDALSDPIETVRSAVAHALGDINRTESVQPLLEQLAVETADPVRLEILTALEVMCLERFYNNPIGKLSAEQKTRLTNLLITTREQDTEQALKDKVLFWLEYLAHEQSKKAQKLALKADLTGAETILLAALALIPDSKNINQQLGQLYYLNGEKQKGLAILEGAGLVARASKLSAPPNLDGDLDEAVWQETVPLQQFHPCVDNLRARPTDGRSEVFVGYVGQTIYFGIRGYEESTTNLAAAITQRDAQVYRDDCTEIFLDPGLTQQTFWQINANSLATIEDAKVTSGRRDMSWNGDIAAAAHVASNFWSVEIAIPAAELDGQRIKSGDVWGFNASRVRIAYASELGQWVPTYGFTGRPEKFGMLFFE